MADDAPSRVRYLESRGRSLSAELRAARQLARLRKELTPAVRPTRPNALVASVQLAHLVRGAIPSPNGTDRVFMEIGCSDMVTADDEVLPSQPTTFLISFEPLLDKYAVLLARGTRRYHGGQGADKAVPLAHHQ